MVTVTVPPRRRRGWGSRPLVFQVFARYLAGRLERPAVLPCVAQTGVLSPVGGDQASVSPVGSPLESRVSPAHIGPSNACHRAAPETTVMEIVPNKALSLSLSLSLSAGRVSLAGPDDLGLRSSFDPPDLDRPGRLPTTLA